MRFTQINIDFNNHIGPMKPMHATNNGPVYKYHADQRVTNLESFQEAGIPYCRTHDSPEVRTYGGPHVVDITAIFPDFEKDPTDPNSYDFLITDEYLKVINLAGAKVFYRLGQTIEHFPKKYHIYPPKDFHKWAVICEHIIRHYTEGWANGHHMDIEYWEIWNEPDTHEHDDNKTCWGGTRQQFFEFFNVVYAHLKHCFPNLKIGGPAIASELDWADDFLSNLKTEPDFFSWHIYSNEPTAVLEQSITIRKMLDSHGFTHTESILNEWNYVCGWNGNDWLRTLKADKSIKGATFIASTMCVCQYAPVDMLMYYNAAPHIMNGMFSADILSERLKGYYPFKMFNELYRLGSCAEISCGENEIYACASSCKTEAAIMIANYSDEDQFAAKNLKITVNGFHSNDGILAKYYLLDKDNDLCLMREEIFTGDIYSPILSMPHQSAYLITLSYLNQQKD